MSCLKNKTNEAKAHRNRAIDKSQLEKEATDLNACHTTIPKMLVYKKEDDFLTQQEIRGMMTCDK
jgi:hypothetical protein